MAAGARKLDQALAALAGQQRGAVTRRQLLDAGLTRNTIQARIASGHLTRVHPGVYLVGLGPPPPLAYESAAILACQPSAVLSRRTAARLWRLPVRPGGPIEVTVVGRHRRSLDGVRVGSMATLPRFELRRVCELPLTSPSLTLLDLAGNATEDELATALNEARVLRIVSDAQLRATLEHHPTRRGARALRARLDRERGPRLTRSDAERLALKAMRSSDLEPDASDVQVGPHRVDFLFRRERLVVEVDGYRYHASPERFVSDRRRIAALAALGHQVVPLSWWDLTDGIAEAMDRLERTLQQRRQQLGLDADPAENSR